MKLLLEECLDERLRLRFSDRDCQTARFANLSGLSDNELLDAAEAAGFEVLITVDQRIPYQQNLENRTISIVILVAATNRLEDLEAPAGQLLAKLASLSPGQVLTIRWQGAEKRGQTQLAAFFGHVLN